MTRTTIFVMSALALALSGLPGIAAADTISPDTISATIGVGGTVKVTKEVTVTKGVPTTAQADVLFVTDTTGSMGPVIASVQSGFATVISSLSGNFAFGSAQFKDQTNAGDPFNYRLDQNITTNTTAVQTALNAMTAAGGGDIPEQSLYSLTQAANTTSWRAGSKRIIVMASDAPSHDDAHPAVPVSTTVASTAAALSGANVITESISPVTGFGSTLNDFGQFSGAGSIYADGAAGNYFSGINPSDITAAILSAIGTAFSTYGSVTLAAEGLPAGVGFSFTPPSFTGSYDRSIDRTFDFGVTFTGLAPGTYDFKVNALVDGGIVATETDHIVVTAVPEPGVLSLLGLGLAALGAARRRRA